MIVSGDFRQGTGELRRVHAEMEQREIDSEKIEEVGSFTIKRADGKFSTMTVHVTLAANGNPCFIVRVERIKGRPIAKKIIGAWRPARK